MWSYDVLCVTYASLYVSNQTVHATQSKLEKKLEAAKAKMDEEKKDGADEDEEGGSGEGGSGGGDEEMDEKARRKAEKAAKKAKKAEKEAKKLAKLQKKAAGGSDEGSGDEGGKDEKNADGEGGEDEVFYGAPDDHAWTDSSHAMKEAEKNKDDGPDLSVSCEGVSCTMLISAHIMNLLSFMFSYHTHINNHS